MRPPVCLLAPVPEPSRQPAAARPLRAALCLLLLATGAALLPQPALAWKPKHHIYTGNEAIAEVLAGADRVTIAGQPYEVPAEVAQAIRNQPASYRAGCIGPDGFPDLVFGQTIIHPDWKQDGGTYTHQWLNHVYAWGWRYYHEHGGDAVGQQGLAFAYGFLTHAGGDLWGHTLINSFAGGSWPDIPDGDLRIAIRHIIVEEYIAQRVPPTDMTIAVPEDFIYRAFIADGAAWQMSRNSSIPFGIPFFLNLRAGLVTLHNSLGCRWYNPFSWLNCAIRAYLRAWVADIDAGLRAWPGRMAAIGRYLFVDETDGHMDRAKAELEDFAYDHLLSMYGAPDFIGGFLSGWDALIGWIEGLIGINIPGVGDIIVWAIESAYGIDFDDLKEYFTNPASYVDTPPLFATDTSSRLDALLHGSGESFDGERFVANRNTVELAKMILLGPAQMNELLADHDVGPLYGGANDAMPPGMRENVMLGFIRSLDGDHQWRRTQAGAPSVRHSEGMPLWVDCQARELVFRARFSDWEAHVPPANFPDEGDACECWNDLPPTIDVAFDRDVLWPANHELAPIKATVTLEDDCDPAPTFALLSITSSEPDDGRGDGNFDEDIQGADIGAPDVEFALRCERSAAGEGRVYTVTYAARDDKGNADTASFHVRVPHDRAGSAVAATCLPSGPAGAPGAASARSPRLLVIPSATDDLRPPSRKVAAIDPARACVGNEKGQFAAGASWVADVTGDGIVDLVLAFPPEARLDGGRNLGFRYEDRSGRGYLVADLSRLGAPLQLGECPTEGGALTAVAPPPAATALVAVRPNPFNATTTVSFDLATAGWARLDVYDLRGVLVRTLQNGLLGAGAHVSAWDGRNGRGEAVPSGVYFVRLASGSVRQTMKAVLLK